MPQIKATYEDGEDEAREQTGKFSLEQDSGQVSMPLYTMLWNLNYVLKKMGFRSIRGERRTRKNKIRSVQLWSGIPYRKKSEGIISKQDMTAEVQF